MIPVCHFLFALDYVNDRFLPGVPSKPFLAVCHWSVFVLPFSQTSLVMVTLKAHGFNKNYSYKNLLLFNVELLFQLTFSFSLGWKLFWSLNGSLLIAKEFGLLSQNLVSSTLFWVLTQHWRCSYLFSTTSIAQVSSTSSILIISVSTTSIPFAYESVE